MKEIRIYGHLRAQFGTSFTLDAATPGEAIRALCNLIPGFRAAIEDYEPGFRVRVGRSSLDTDELAMAGGEVIRLVPCVVGAKSGWGQILTGVAIIAAVFLTGGMAGVGFSMIGTSALSTLAISVGTSMVLGGVAQVLAGNPTYSGSAMDKGPADQPSYAFSGPHMTVGQGNPVPLGYGKLRVSGALVSLGISPETWTTNGLGGKASDEVGTQTGDGDTTPWVWALAPAT